MAYDLGNGVTLNSWIDRELQLFGDGDHGGGPTRTILDRGIRWADPKVSFPGAQFRQRAGLLRSGGA